MRHRRQHQEDLMMQMSQMPNPAIEQSMGGAIGPTPLPSVGMVMPAIPLTPNVSVSTANQPSPAFMNPMATTTTGAVLPVIPQVPDISMQPPAMVTPTAMLAESYVATQGTESPADTDVYAHIPYDHRGNILGSTAFGPSNNLRTNIMMSNYT